MRGAMNATLPWGRGVRAGRVALLVMVPGVLLIDMINGVLGGAAALRGIPSPAEAVRGAILLYGLITLARAIHPGLGRLQGWVVVLAVLGSLGLLRAFFDGGSTHELRVNVAQLMKTLYGPVLTLLLVVEIRRHHLSLSDLLDAVAWVAGLAGGSIVLLTLLGLGQQTYQLHDAGAKGLFIAQNDIGVAMGIGLVGCVDMLLRTARLRYIVLGALGMAGMLMLGTRAALAGAFLLPLAMLINYRSRIFGGRRRAFLGILAGLSLILALAAAGAWEYRALRAETYQQQKLQALADNPFVRGVRVLAALDHVRQRPLLADVMGEGFLAYTLGVARNFGQNIEGVLAEVDWMDLYGAYGILFAIAIYLFYFESARLARGLRRRHDAAIARTALLAIGWFLLHSAVAGHALAGTIPAGTLAPMLALVWSERPELLGPGVLDA